jgi:hypothetical protein
MQCRHDEALLRAGHESLARAEAELGEAEAAHRRAGEVEWEGSAADSFRARTAFIAAELAALTAGLAALGCLFAAVQGELQDCDAGLPITSAQGPLLPVVSSGQLLPRVSQPPMLPYQAPRAVPPTPSGQELCR